MSDTSQHHAWLDAHQGGPWLFVLHDFMVTFDLSEDAAVAIWEEWVSNG